MFLAGVFAGLPAVACADAETDLLGDRVLGSADAPLTMVEYSSLTCGHCAAFHEETFPEIKKAYVDTGKVRFVFRDFPFEQRGLTASMLARCVPPARFFGFLAVLFRTHDKWASDPHFPDDLRGYARLGGLSDAAFDECLANQELLDAILARQDEGRKKFDIDSTPTFIIGDEKRVGALPLEAFRKVIDAKLEK